MVILLVINSLMANEECQVDQEVNITTCYCPIDYAFGATKDNKGNIEEEELGHCYQCDPDTTVSGVNTTENGNKCKCKDGYVPTGNNLTNNINQVCYLCPTNYYISGDVCIRCPTGYVTSKTGSTTKNDCYKPLGQWEVFGIIVAIFVAIAIITTITLFIIHKAVLNKRDKSIKKAGVQILDSQKKPDIMNVEVNVSNQTIT